MGNLRQLAVHDAPWSYAGAARGPEEPVNLMGRAIAASGGDIEAALAAADRVFEHTFRTQTQHHGYLEPHSCTVAVEPDGTVKVWSCNKSPYRLRLRSPSFNNLSVLPSIVEGNLIADVVAAIGSLDPVMGEVDR